MKMMPLLVESAFKFGALLLLLVSSAATAAAADDGDDMPEDKQQRELKEWNAQWHGIQFHAHAYSHTTTTSSSSSSSGGTGNAVQCEAHGRILPISSACCAATLGIEKNYKPPACAMVHVPSYDCVAMVDDHSGTNVTHCTYNLEKENSTCANQIWDTCTNQAGGETVPWDVELVCPSITLKTELLFCLGSPCSDTEIQHLLWADSKAKGDGCRVETLNGQSRAEYEQLLTQQQQQAQPQAQNHNSNSSNNGRNNDNDDDAGFIAMVVLLAAIGFTGVCVAWGSWTKSRQYRHEPIQQNNDFELSASPPTYNNKAVVLSITTPERQSIPIMGLPQVA